MAAPIMATIAEDALKAVPDSYREAAEAMGATRWQVIRQVVLPSAKSGLVAAVLLGVGRGFGETMAVLMARPSINIPDGPFDPVRALTATIPPWLWETANGSEHYRALFTLGILLFAVTFVINFLADVLVRRGPEGRMNAESLNGFRAEPLDKRNQRNEKSVRMLFRVMTILLIVPVA